MVVVVVVLFQILLSLYASALVIDLAIFITSTLNIAPAEPNLNSNTTYLFIHFQSFTHSNFFFHACFSLLFCVCINASFDHVRDPFSATNSVDTQTLFVFFFCLSCSSNNTKKRKIKIRVTVAKIKCRDFKRFKSMNVNYCVM